MPGKLYAAEDPLRSLTDPTTADLQSTFAAVGTGRLPTDYPLAASSGLVPTTLLEAVAWAESSWRQYDSAHRPLVSADGGYGIMQVTSGMEPGDLPQSVQSAIANNVLYNVDYGALILMQKLHGTPSIGDGDPSVLEHWYYALWAYNAWGWTNNPNNPQFTRVGTPDTDPWAYPYQERIFYYLAHPPLGPSGVPLWKAIPVETPSPSEVGADPGPLPEVTYPHTDSTSASAALDLPVERGARYLGDVTIPDGTVLQPGQHFTKTWRLLNDGTVTWGDGFRLMPAGGPDLGSDAGVSLEPTPSLASVDVSVNLVAPSVAGTYKEYWQMVDSNGRSFGARIWVSIVVGNGGTSAQAPDSSPTSATNGTATSNTSTSPSPAVTGTTTTTATVLAESANSVAERGATPVLKLSRASKVQRQQVASTNGDAAVYAGDVTIPDGTILAPGTHFIKVWRLKNVGTTNWTPSYTWRFQAGTLMSSHMSVSVSRTAPGTTTIVSVPMEAPTATGVYTSFWQMANPSGKFFPHQAWVKIVVKGTVAAATPATHSAPTATPTPSPTSLAGPTATVATRYAQPTQVIAGSDGQLVASPWVGSLSFRTYFSSGSTEGPMQESIGVYNPGTSQAHIRMTVYRPDAAERELEFTLAGNAKRVFALSRIAPGTGLSVAVEADRNVVAERVDTSTSGILANPAVANTGRTWLFPSVPDGAPPVQELVLFNPSETSATVQAHVGVLAGACCAADLTLAVPPLEQYVYRLGSSSSWQGPISLQSSTPISVERLAVSSTMSSILGVPGTTAAENTWYLPEVHGGPGSTITLFNPGSRAVTATIHTALTGGSGPWLLRSVPAHTEVRVPVSSITSAREVSVQVDATAPVVAGSEWQDGAPLPVASVGGVATANSWSIIGGLGGGSTSDSISIYNPSAQVANATFRIVPTHGAWSTWSIVVAGHGRYARSLAGLEPSSGAIIAVTTSRPVAIAHTIASSSGAAVAPAAIVTGSQ